MTGPFFDVIGSLSNASGWPDWAVSVCMIAVSITGSAAIWFWESIKAFVLAVGYELELAGKAWATFLLLAIVALGLLVGCFGCWLEKKIEAKS